MDLKNKKVLVFGVGVSGKSAISLLKSVGAQIFVMGQGDPKTWGLDYSDNLFEEADYEKLPPMDLIILSPGIPKDHRALSLQSAPIFSEIELAYRFCKTPILAITGTNGKTTTVSFLGQMLKACGKKIFVGGNIGIPFCDYVQGPMDADYVLLELSSFQLESIIEFKPVLAAILNLFPNHGERYQGLEDYGYAKSQIAKNMDEEAIVWVPEGYPIATKAKVIEVVLDANQCESKIEYDLSRFKLVGFHNLLNLYFCLQFAKELHLDSKGIQEAIDTFPGVPHRIEFVTDRPITVYNDAKSTNLDATLVAVKAVAKENQKLGLILGGQKRGKGEDASTLISALKKSCSKVFVIGEASDDLYNQLSKDLNVIKSGTLENVLKECDGIDTLLFSPGFPSFDQFKNYAHRGEVFKQLVNAFLR